MKPRKIQTSMPRLCNFSAYVFNALGPIKTEEFPIRCTVTKNNMKKPVIAISTLRPTLLDRNCMTLSFLH